MSESSNDSSYSYSSKQPTVTTYTYYENDYATISKPIEPYYRRTTVDIYEYIDS